MNQNHNSQSHCNRNEVCFQIPRNKFCFQIDWQSEKKVHNLVDNFSQILMILSVEKVSFLNFSRIGFQKDKVTHKLYLTFSTSTTYFCWLFSSADLNMIQSKFDEWEEEDMEIYGWIYGIVSNVYGIAITGATWSPVNDLFVIIIIMYFCVSFNNNSNRNLNPHTIGWRKC